MNRLSIIASLSISLFACGKKADPGAGSGSGSPTVVDPGSGTAAKPITPDAPYQMGSGSGSNIRPVEPLAANEKRIGRSNQLDVVELTDKATPTGKTYEIRGAGKTYSMSVVGGVDVKDVPDVTEFPISTPDHKNMNSTIVSFHYATAAVQFSVTSFDEIAKAGTLAPERLKDAFDRSQTDMLSAMSLKLDKATDGNIAGSTGRTVAFSGESPDKKKIAGKAWLVFLEKANVYVVFQVLAVPDDPLLGKAEEFLKTLSIAP